jgi:hypothetical protein
MFQNKTVRLVTLFAATLISTVSVAATTKGNASFTITPLLRPDGGSETAISIASDGTMGMTALSWQQFVTHYWSGAFGSTPTFRGEIDSALQLPGKRKVFGGGDADVDIGSTGTLHGTTLIFLTPPTVTSFTLGVSAITCSSALQAVPAGCTSQIIDTAGADRQWITSDGGRVWISYHDAGNSTLIHVQRSDDDGYTWKKVGSPIPGQGAATGDATFNNDQGPIVADPYTHNLYDIYAAGEASVQKGTSANFNNIYVSRSTDGGQTWTAVLVYHAPLFTALNNVFPSLAVDPTNGTLYAVWSDGHTVSLSKSTDQGLTWSSAVAVSAAPATTAIFPWVAAYNGALAVTYYGTTAGSNSDSSAVWYTYVAQSFDAENFVQSRVNSRPNHVGVICTEGTACAAGTRNLLDLFEIAFDPQNGKLGVIYTDDTLTTDSAGNPLPQAVLAQQK